MIFDASAAANFIMKSKYITVCNYVHTTERVCVRVFVCVWAHNLVVCGMRQRVFIGRYFNWSRGYNGNVISEKKEK